MRALARATSPVSRSRSYRGSRTRCLRLRDQYQAILVTGLAPLIRRAHKTVRVKRATGRVTNQGSERMIRRAPKTVRAKHPTGRVTKQDRPRGSERKTLPQVIDMAMPYVLAVIPNSSACVARRIQSAIGARDVSDCQRDARIRVLHVSAANSVWCQAFVHPVTYVAFRMATEVHLRVRSQFRARAQRAELPTQLAA